MTKIIGLLGGTLDPVHLGHVHVAHSILEKIPLDTIQFIPLYQPVHRQNPIASAEHRWNMLKIALKNEKRLTANNIEIKRQDDSYTIKTIKQLKSKHPGDHLVFITGTDSYASFTEWDDWQEILSYCHLIVVDRPQQTKANHDELKRYETNDWQDILNHGAGKIYHLNIPTHPASSTAVRAAIKAEEPLDHLLNQGVIEYIQAHKLYATK